MNASPSLSLYVHLPWCVRKCPYCDFNSHPLRGRLPEEAYLAALLADLEQDLEALGIGDRRKIVSVFFGGGTPSLFAPASLAAVLDHLRAHARITPDAEVTLEANPGTLEHACFGEYRSAGINRVSLGVQSFDDVALERIGRIHNAAQARSALGAVQRAGIAEINIDLMYALPGQTRTAALADVQEACRHAPTHVSHYQLTLEAGTPFARRPPERLPDADSAWAMQLECQAWLAASGYEQYEVSAYARAGHQCRHNLNYWRFGDYLGIGAGAHAKITDASGRILRTRKQRHPTRYMATAHGPQRVEAAWTVPPADASFEYCLNALRLRDILELDHLELRTACRREVVVAALGKARDRGLMQALGEGSWRVTDLGWRFLDDTIAMLLPGSDPNSAATSACAK